LKEKINYVELDFFSPGNFQRIKIKDVDQLKKLAGQMNSPIYKYVDQNKEEFIILDFKKDLCYFLPSED
jgi:peptide subunit release factor RF-3